MTKKLTPKQEKAIKQMNNAIAQLRRCGIVMFGMDSNLHWITSTAVNQYAEKGGEKYYGAEADAFQNINGSFEDQRSGEFKTKGVYIDSGAW